MGAKGEKYSKGASYPEGEPKRRRPKRGLLSGKRISSTFKSEAKQKDITEAPLKPITGWRLWLFRIIAITIIPALLFLLLEITLRIVGYGFPASAIIECKVGGKNVYCDNIKFSWRFFSRGLAREFDPFIFPADKPDKTYRIFILGESAAQGEPDAAFCFGRFLRVMLQEQYPGVNFEVITAAMAAINSHAALEAAKNCARHQPDLFIVYLGNNEVIGPYGAGTVFSPLSGSLSFIRFDMTLKATKVGQLLMNLSESVSPQKDIPKVWQGMGMFLEKQVRADASELQIVYRHFRRNLEDIKRVANNSGSKIIFCTVGSNLKSNPPFASLHRAGMTEPEKKKWDEIYQQGIAYQTSGAYGQAVECCLTADKICGAYAELQFRLGRCYWAMGDYGKARDRYIRARELDTLRFRADNRINEIIRAVAGDDNAEDVYLVDVVDAFEKNSPNNIPGDELFYEHVHLNFKGNYVLAKTVFEQVDKILPNRIKAYKVNGRPLPTEADCAQRLAYTDWDSYKSADEVLNGFIKKAPFTNQLGHEQQTRVMEENLAALKADLTKEVLEKAASQYRRAIENDSNDWVLHWKYGELLAEDLKDYRAAAEQYRLVQGFLPHSYIGYNALGSVLRGLGDVDAAIAEYLKAIRIKPTCGDAHYYMGWAYNKKGRIDKAKEHYLQAVRWQPERVAAYNNLAEILSNQGKIAQAVEICRRGLLFVPDSAILHCNLGLLLSKQGNKDEAVKEIRLALEIEPNSVQIRRVLDAVLKGRGDFEQN